MRTALMELKSLFGCESSPPSFGIAVHKQSQGFQQLVAAVLFYWQYSPFLSPLVAHHIH